MSTVFVSHLAFSVAVAFLLSSLMRSVALSILSNPNISLKSEILSVGCNSKTFVLSCKSIVVLKNTSLGGRNDSSVACTSVSFLDTIASVCVFLTNVSSRSISRRIILLLVSALDWLIIAFSASPERIVCTAEISSSMRKIDDFTVSFQLLVLAISLTQSNILSLCANKIFIHPLSAFTESIGRELYLYKPNSGPSKNKKLFPDHIGALIKYFPSRK